MDPAGSTSRVIAANEYRRVRWKNQLGWTREITRFPDTDDWDWRASIAEIESDAAFSAFPGVDRELVLLTGNGLRLRFEDGQPVVLPPPHGRHRFAGEDAAHGELLDGRTTDFNLMWRRDAITADLWIRPLVGAMVLFCDPHETWLLHLVAGQATFDAASGLPAMLAGDTAVLGGGAGRERHVVDGAGTALLARLRSASAARIPGAG